jgi:hypothetical protein
MNYFEERHNIWPSDDLFERAWYIYRRAVEEAEARYGLYLFGSVRTEGNYLFMVKLTGHGHKASFVLGSELERGGLSPNAILENLVWPILREFAEKRDGKKQQFSEKFDRAVTAAQRSKKLLKITNIYDDCSTIIFYTNKELAEALGRWGKITQLVLFGYWILEVDPRYDFDLVINVLKALEIEEWD